ncbi:MAG: 2-dehydropantoate 2-reductase [Desulfuromonas sp.]|uniref:putative 2-dehydropantoate 2-reductase n=1 Tax=Desulfuromonas sp. TaxID=892 RepID=UPI000CB0F2D1|nr:putative 2-dehydropantoate 2-reductase [Desulfuromonas sp.]PLX83381.1 MAG: 2-dehydropantoate 2-reductase [Desulfuromonas sp.]
MRIAIIGAGALGLYYGAMLQRAGNEVQFLLRRDFEAVCSRGLTVTSPKGDFHLARVLGFRNPDEMGPADLVLVGLKTIDNERLAELVRPLMQKNTAVLTLQNGLGNEELLAEAFGPERVLGGVAFLCSNRGAPGTVHHLGEGAVRLGEFSGKFSARAEGLAATFSAAGIPCQSVPDLVKARWEKLVWNIPFNGLCALTGKTTSDLLASPAVREQALALMGEVVEAANAQGLSNPIDGNAFCARMMGLTEGMDRYRPSMMIDRQEGRPLELEAIFGTPLRRAAEKGVEMTRVRLLEALLKLGE